ncbi:hypothetical protein PQX77_016261 [Marasmius sp. AFHP31]|nr:hypothetical protein PQX77_016261 [Marasmius sp. AFHP31]
MTEVEDMGEASEGQALGTAAKGKIGEITPCVLPCVRGPPSIEDDIREVTLLTASVSGAGSTTPLDPSPSPNASLSLFPPCQSPKSDLNGNLLSSCPSSAATNSYPTDTSAPNLTITALLNYLAPGGTGTKSIGEGNAARRFPCWEAARMYMRVGNQVPESFRMGTVSSYEGGCGDSSRG